MSAEQVQAFLKLFEDDQFRAGFEAATPEARRAMLIQAGLNIPLEEAEAALKGERELGEQELDKVAGGLKLEGLKLEGLNLEGLKLQDLKLQGRDLSSQSPPLMPSGPLENL